LNALRAFEAAARSGNFTRAAEALGVSQAAVSQHVKALEATLGVKLFARDGKRLVITDAGQEYLAVVRDALDRIAVGTDRLLQRQASSVLAVTTTDRSARLVNDAASRPGGRASGRCDPAWRSAPSSWPAATALRRLPTC
jgi:DNA-binding transcriptional LysR family regulator